MGLLPPWENPNAEEHIHLWKLCWKLRSHKTEGARVPESLHGKEPPAEKIIWILCEWLKKKKKKTLSLSCYIFCSVPITVKTVIFNTNFRGLLCPMTKSFTLPSFSVSPCCFFSSFHTLLFVHFNTLICYVSPTRYTNCETCCSISHCRIQA